MHVERSITGKLRPGEKPLLRLMIFLPPGHGKSELTSINFPAWFLGRNPDLRVIMSAHTQGLAREFSEKCRTLVSGPDHAELGWASTRKGSRTKDFWNIDGHRGSVLAVGIGGATTGRRAHLFLIDDPVKDQKEAMSEVSQKNQINWFDSVARTRLMPNSAIVIIQTRWAKKDLSGQLLMRQAQGAATKWKILKLRAISIPGEVDPMGRYPGQALWPEFFTVGYLMEARDSPWFWPLYQQEPQDPAGTDFRREWFILDKLAPQCTKHIRFWDCAAKEKQTSDATASVLMGTGDNTAHRWIKDVTVGRHNFPELKIRVKNLAKLDPPGTIIAIEDTSSGIALAQDLRADKELGAYAIWNVPVHEDKRIRAAPYASAARMGYVHIALGHMAGNRYVEHPWVLEYLDELVNFFSPGMPDDQVDASSGANQGLYVAGGHFVEQMSEEEQIESMPAGLEKDSARIQAEGHRILAATPDDLQDHLRSILQAKGFGGGFTG